MPCTGRYAEAWEFVAFWFTGVVWTSNDRSVGGVGNANLFDDQVNFNERGSTVANTGQWLWNLTQGTDGPIVEVVDNNRIRADGVVWDSGDSYRISLLTSQEKGQIEVALDIAASDVHAALAASAQCDCTWSAWSANLASKLNIVDAAAYYQGKCGSPKFTNDQRQGYLAWMSDQLRQIRMSEIDLCAGATGADFPAVGWAEQVTTEFSRAEIILKDIERNAADG
jgi:hypothetical protein